MCCLNKLRILRRTLTKDRYRFLKQLLILFGFTFGIVIPVICSELQNTLLDCIFTRNITHQKLKMMNDNSIRLNDSVKLLNYFNNRYTKGDDGFFKEVFQSDRKLHVAYQSSIYDRSLSNPRISLAISIITVMRNRDGLEDYQPQYLTQTVTKLLELLEIFYKNRQSVDLDIHFSICNVDGDPKSFKELHSLPNWIPVFERFSEGDPIGKPVSLSGRLEKEKQDYVYCLDKLLERNKSFVLLVEDDALPHGDLFPVLESLIFNPKTSGPVFKRKVNDTLFFKLYHPERLLGYISIEVERLPELFGSGFVLAAMLVITYLKLQKTKLVSFKTLWITFFLYSTLIIFIIGRPNVLELRRISRYLYQITPAPDCCTPAMLFPRKGGKIVSDYLKTVTCRKAFGKDTAIDKLKRKGHLVAKMVQPNLFQHIGQFSSLRSELVNPFIV